VLDDCVVPLKPADVEERFTMQAIGEMRSERIA
jgi:hypothetical protein